MSDLATTNKNTPQGVIKDVNVQKMIQERLGKRAGQFTTSLLSIVNNNKMIAACKPMTIIQAALTAASLDLPINQNLGFAYIVPYSGEAQFQMGWKGYVQLAQRTGMFKTINTSDVREGELVGRDRMTGELQFKWIEDDSERNQLPIVGYLAYFKLLNGFSKSSYMTFAEVDAHANRFSQAYRSRGRGGFKSPWETDFDAMAMKTVLKQLLNKYAPLSTEMSEAIAADQSVDDGTERKYVDNDNLENERATDEEKAAIIAANQAPEDGYTEAPVEVDKALDDAAPVTDDQLDNIDNIFAGTETKKEKSVDNPKRKENGK